MELVYAHVVAEPEALVTPRARHYVRSAFESRLVCAHRVSVLVFVHVVVVHVVRARPWIRRPVRTRLTAAGVHANRYFTVLLQLASGSVVLVRGWRHLAPVLVKASLILAD